MQNFEGKVCVITGAASGIGRECALWIGLKNKAKLALFDINQERLGAVVNEINEQGGEAIGIWCDVADEEAVKAAIDKTVETYGRLDYLSSNAAAVAASFTMRDRTFEDFDVDYMMEAFKINCCGSYLMIKYCIPHMLKNGGGSIVCTSSVAAKFGAAGNNVYGMTKAALEALVRATAALYGRQGIRCNAIEPSNTLTPAFLETIPAEFYETMKLGIFNPNFTGGDKIASVIAFLLSEDAYTIQGATIPVDNGYHIVAGMVGALDGRAMALAEKQ